MSVAPHHVGLSNFQADSTAGSLRVPLRVPLRILCGFRAMERARGGPVYVAPHSVGSWKFHAGS